MQHAITLNFPTEQDKIQFMQYALRAQIGYQSPSWNVFDAVSRATLAEPKPEPTPASQEWQLQAQVKAAEIELAEAKRTTEALRTTCRRAYWELEAHVNGRNPSTITLRGVILEELRKAAQIPTREEEYAEANRKLAEKFNR